MDSQDPMVKLGHQDLTAYQVPPDRLDRMDQQDNPDPREPLDPQGCKAPRAPMEASALLGTRDSLATWEDLDNLEWLERVDLQDLLVTLELLDRTVALGPQE